MKHVTRTFLALIAGLLLAPSVVRAQAGAATRSRAQASAVTTVIIVRHAEKAAEPKADPPLDSAGQARAQALAAALRDAGVTAIVTTQFERTKATARPLAERLGITPEVVTAGGGSVGEHAKAVAAAVMQHAGGVVLVVGHSNTVPDIVEALGAHRPADICDAEYDNLFVVRVPASGPASVVHARYGTATPVAAGCRGM